MTSTIAVVYRRPLCGAKPTSTSPRQQHQRWLRTIRCCNMKSETCKTLGHYNFKTRIHRCLSTTSYTKFNHTILFLLSRSTTNSIIMSQPNQRQYYYQNQDTDSSFLQTPILETLLGILAINTISRTCTKNDTDGEQQQQQQQNDTETAEVDFDPFQDFVPYKNVPDVDEETDCSMCRTGRQGPCRLFWRSFEYSVKDLNEKQQQQEKEKNERMANHKKLSSTQEEQQQRSHDTKDSTSVLWWGFISRLWTKKEQSMTEDDNDINATVNSAPLVTDTNDNIVTNKDVEMYAVHYAYCVNMYRNLYQLIEFDVNQNFKGTDNLGPSLFEHTKSIITKCNTNTRDTTSSNSIYYCWKNPDDNNGTDIVLTKWNQTDPHINDKKKIMQTIRNNSQELPLPLWKHFKDDTEDPTIVTAIAYVPETIVVPTTTGNNDNNNNNNKRCRLRFACVVDQKYRLLGYFRYFGRKEEEIEKHNEIVKKEENEQLVSNSNSFLKTQKDVVVVDSKSSSAAPAAPAPRIGFLFYPIPGITTNVRIVATYDEMTATTTTDSTTKNLDSNKESNNVEYNQNTSDNNNNNNISIESKNEKNIEPSSSSSDTSNSNDSSSSSSIESEGMVAYACSNVYDLRPNRQKWWSWNV